MKNKSPETRLAAVEYIKRLGPPAASAAPAMIDALKDEDYYVREAAAMAIGNFGTPSKV